MPGFRVTTSTGKKMLFTTEVIPQKLFGEETWKLAKEGYYLPWVEVEEVRSLEEEAILAVEAVEKESEFVWDDDMDVRR